MGRKIDHQNANNQRRIVENGHESVTDGSRSDGIGRGTSRVFDVAGGSAGNQKVTVRRVAHGSGRRINPNSEEGRRIAAAVLAGQPASPAQKALVPDVSAPRSQMDRRSEVPVERKPLRHEIMEASRQLQGFKPKQKKKKAKGKDLVGQIVGFNSRSKSLGRIQGGAVSRNGENAAKPIVNVIKRDQLWTLIASMFELLSVKRR